MKASFYLILILLLTGTSLKAQRHGRALLDSLQRELSISETPRDQLRLLLSISFHYQWVEARKGIEFGKRSLRLAQLLKDPIGIARAQVNIAANYNLIGKGDSALPFLQSAMETGRQYRNDSVIAYAIFYSSCVNLYKSEYSTMLGQLEQVRSIAVRFKDSFLLGLADINASIAYTNMGEYVKAYASLNAAFAREAGLNHPILLSLAFMNAGCAQYYTDKRSAATDTLSRGLSIATRFAFTEIEAMILQSLGNVYAVQHKSQKALELYLKSLELGEKIGDDNVKVYVMSSIGALYRDLGDFGQARRYFQRAAPVCRQLGNRYLLAYAVSVLGECYERVPDYRSALHYYSNALAICKEIGHRSMAAMSCCDVARMYYFLEDYASAAKYIAETSRLANESRDDRAIGYLYSFLSKVYLQGPDALLRRIGRRNRNSISLAKRYADSTLYYGSKFEDVETQVIGYQLLSEVYEKLGQHAKALSAFRSYVKLQDSLSNTGRRNEITRSEMQFNFSRKQMADSLAFANSHRLAKLELQKQKTYTYAFFAGIIVLVSFSFFVYRIYALQKKSNRLLSVEKEKSEALLLNILPSEVAEELKQTGNAEARHFDNVTVLFTDFVNFTGLAAGLPPQELVDELHSCFKDFDEIIGKYGLEKIKTIGDAYLAVAGLPMSDVQHAINTVHAAIEIRDLMISRASGGYKLGGAGAIRIGIHSGAVVAGIVGVKKFAYDIWGDTVNTAARMEQNSEPGRINISEASYELVKDRFDCTHRGEIKVKNKGVMKMFFVNGIHA